MEPIRFIPILKQARWGGRRLATRLGKVLGPGQNYAESWELADHHDDTSVVASGPLSGSSLRDLVREHGRALLGRHAGADRFPLLLKFLDAHDRLSVQVHPNDQQAARYLPGGQGKTEAWVMIDAEPGACIYAGLRPGVRRHELEAALESGQVEQCLHKLAVAPGDCFYIPAGMLHAIGEGVLLAEVQQSSDLTFRLFDWNRLGPDGQPRPLHRAEALDCTNFELAPASAVVPRILDAGPPRSEMLVDCPYFVLKRHTGGGIVQLPDDGRCRALMLLAGGARWWGAPGDELSAGQTVLVPAGALPRRLMLSPEAAALEIFWH